MRITSFGSRRVLNRRNLKATAIVLAYVAFSLIGPGVDSALLGQDKVQTWTDSSGKKNIEADFVKLNGVSLVLRKPDGQEVTVPLSKLDDKSRLRARALAKAPPSRPKVSDSDTSESGSESTRSASGVWASEAPVVFNDNQTAGQFIAVLDQELKKQNLLVVWDMLPAKKQAEVQELVRLASSRVEQRTLDLIKRFRSELLGALRSKREFVLNSKVIPYPPGQVELLETSYDGIVNLIEAMIAEDLLDASTLQNTELRVVSRKYINDVMARAEELDRLIPADSPLKSMIMNPELKFDFKVESSTQYEAMISAVAPGQTNRVPQKFTFADGRWLPAELVQSWDSAMAQSMGGLQSLDPKQLHKQIGQGLLFVNGILSSISSAETQQEFDEAIQQLIGLAQMGMSMGGGQPPGSVQPPGFSGGQPGFSGGQGMLGMPAGASGTGGSDLPQRPGVMGSGSGGGGNSNSGSSDGPG